MSITVTRYITEHVQGKQKSDESSTGWRRRATSERVPTNESSRKPGVMAGRDGNYRVRTIWEECEGPRTVVYNSTEHLESGISGGTVSIEITGCESVEMTLESDEVEYLIRRYIGQYSDAMFSLGGGVGGRKMTTDEAIALRQQAIDRAARFGVDLPSSNVTGRDF